MLRCFVCFLLLPSSSFFLFVAAVSTTSCNLFPLFLFLLRYSVNLSFLDFLCPFSMFHASFLVPCFPIVIIISFRRSRFYHFLISFVLLPHLSRRPLLLLFLFFSFFPFFSSFSLFVPCIRHHHHIISVSGWRLDHFLISPSLLPHVRWTARRPHVNTSDHIPIVLTLNLP